jgi:hypothetical protein
MAFYHDHGLSIQIDADDPDRARRIFDHMHDHEMKLVSTDPPVVEVTAVMHDDEIRLRFDETVSVVDVR